LALAPVLQWDWQTALGRSFFRARVSPRRRGGRGERQRGGGCRRAVLLAGCPVIGCRLLTLLLINCSDSGVCIVLLLIRRVAGWSRGFAPRALNGRRGSFPHTRSLPPMTWRALHDWRVWARIFSRKNARAVSYQLSAVSQTGGGAVRRLESAGGGGCVVRGVRVAGGSWIWPRGGESFCQRRSAGNDYRPVLRGLFPRIGESTAPNLQRLSAYEIRRMHR